MNQEANIVLVEINILPQKILSHLFRKINIYLMNKVLFLLILF